MKIKDIRNLIFFFLLLLAPNLFAQIRAGSAFLKMLPGARLQSMAAAQTGVIEDMHAIYANPGAAGFLREWQWSASYTKWIADIYNASFIYGQNIRMPWSRHTRFALGILYQGMPDFDSTDDMMPMSSSSDLIASLSIGQPLTFISNYVSFGSNVKYLRSKLDQFDTSGWAFDTGMSARTPRFGLGNSLFPYGIFSLGFAVTQLGSDLKFNTIGTPLPQTWRAGVAFYTGSHTGLQLLLTADYQEVRDEQGAFGLGAEFTVNRTFSINGGYNFDNDLFEKVSFGASIRLDDINTSLGDVFPGRNNALRLDIASMNEQDFFSRTYRGTASDYPIGPEKFRFMTFADIDTFLTNTVPIHWEPSADPDLFDDIYYTLLLDQDSVKMANLEYLYKKDPDKLFTVVTDSTFLVKEKLSETKYLFTNAIGGNYYWTVFAVDKDRHVRMAEKDNRHIARFYVPMPDIDIEKIEFKYDPWITMNEYQGKLLVTIDNKGDRTGNNFIVTVSDSLAVLKERLLESDAEEPITRLLSKATIDSLQPGEQKIIPLEWNTKWLGKHVIIASADVDSVLAEWNEDNNLVQQDVYTIPKGQISTADTAIALLNSRVVIDMPIVTEVTFNENSSDVSSDYLTFTHFDPHLSIIADRLVRHPQYKIQLQGYADPNSEVALVDLADRRSRAVRDTLIHRGVNPGQIKITKGQVWPLRRVPSNPDDARWIFEERRMVKISSDSVGQEGLFLPLKHTDNETLLKHLIFQTQLKYAVPAFEALALYYGKGIRDTISLNLDTGSNINKDIQWLPINKEDLYWDEKEAEYHIMFTDTLGRTFRTKTKNVVMHKRDIIRENRIAVPLKFAQTDPLYDFYLDKLFEQTSTLLENPNMRIAFSGHACATGSAAINESLSDRRAKSFFEVFKNYMKRKHPDYYDSILQRVDQTKGFGEYNPMQIERLTGEVILIGDNEKSTGRILNRRIEIKIYMKDSPLY